LKRQLKYRIENLKFFEKKLFETVDFSRDYKDYIFNPKNIKSDYFGKKEWNNFEIYVRDKILFQQRTILKIIGEINENQLILRIFYHYIWIAIISTIISISFSIYLIYSSFFYLGMTILVLLVVQTFLNIRSYNVKRKEFLEFIEKNLKNTA